MLTQIILNQNLTTRSARSPNPKPQKWFGHFRDRRSDLSTRSVQIGPPKRHQKKIIHSRKQSNPFPSRFLQTEQRSSPSAPPTRDAYGTRVKDETHRRWPGDRSYSRLPTQIVVQSARGARDGRSGDGRDLGGQGCARACGFTGARRGGGRARLPWVRGGGEGRQRATGRRRRGRERRG